MLRKITYAGLVVFLIVLICVYWVSSTAEQSTPNSPEFATTSMDTLYTTMFTDASSQVHTPKNQADNVLEDIRKSLARVEEIGGSCKSDNAEIEIRSYQDAETAKQGTMYFIRCLRPKIKTVIWYASNQGSEYVFYNYDYLSVLNLYGYHLHGSGDSQNHEELEQFQKEGGVIQLAQNKNTDVYLSVYSKNRDDIKIFLSSKLAQAKLITNLSKLIESAAIKGINIYFEDFFHEDAHYFTVFIRRLREALSVIAPELQLSITIPFISDSKSLLTAKAYNFADLSSYVNNYLVSDGLFTFHAPSTVQSGAAVLNDSGSDKNHAQLSMDFYSNGKVPSNKLIFPLSHLNIDGKPDDMMSLYLRYNWALENKVGGISILSIGHELSNDSERWNAFAASLLQIDTKVVEIVF